jgi:hypothetical protein
MNRGNRSCWVAVRGPWKSLVCIIMTALRKFSDLHVEFPEFVGVHQVNGVNNATVSFQSESVIVYTQDCTYNDVDYRYVCDYIDSEEFPLAFTQTAVASGGAYSFRDKSVDSGPGFVIKTNALSNCKEVSNVMVNLVLGDTHWNTEESSIGTGHLCQFKRGYSEKYTVS